MADPKETTAPAPSKRRRQLIEQTGKYACVTSVTYTGKLEDGKPGRCHGAPGSLIDERDIDPTDLLSLVKAGALKPEQKFVED